jgi:hypothetical protein
MTRRLTRIALFAVLSAAALVAAGCGSHAVVTHADTEGVWVDAGPLNYHVQGSRLLEPGLVPDKTYLAGLPAAESELGADEAWFAVFLRIENRSEESVASASDFEILDTTGASFRPIRIDTAVNPFAYQQATLEPKDVLPVPDSAQDTDSFGGAMLLFKLPLTNYANRPLNLKIHSAGGDGPESATVTLDV